MEVARGRGLSLHGNIAWKWLAAAALALLRVEQGALELAGDVSTAVNVAVQDIIDESRIAVTRAISVPGAFLSVVLLWWLQGSC